MADEFKFERDELVGHAAGEHERYIVLYRYKHVDNEDEDPLYLCACPGKGPVGVRAFFEQRELRKVPYRESP